MDLEQDLDLELTPQNWPNFEHSYGDKNLRW